METSAFHLVLNAGTVVKLVLLMLLFFSVVSWAIIIYKYRYLSSAMKENHKFTRAFRSTRDSQSVLLTARQLTISPAANVFRSVYAEQELTNRDEIRRALKRFEALENSKLERHLGFLATTGSTTPFIGLFGTVWGIMDSFRGIGASGSASLAVVAPGIAEALIATAVGLVAAIPAVIAYNYYLGRTRLLIVEMEDFSEDILARLTQELRARR